MSALSELCQACALCCEGSLFRFVRLTADEAEELSRAGAEVFRRRDGAPAMRLGCKALCGTRCTLYDARPGGCRAYVCVLGQQLEAGRLTLADALERAREARELVAEVERNLPGRTDDDPRSVMQRAQLHGLLCGPEPLRRAEAFLRVHFLGEP